MSKECLSPFFPDRTLKQRAAGIVDYPTEDERLGGQNEQRSLPCNRCENCYNTRRRRWVGRTLAEVSTSSDAVFVTCTYGHDPAAKRLGVKRDHPHASAFHREDGQKWIKRLRIRGHKLSYLWVLERGDENNRVHLHAILCFKGGVSPFKHGRDWNDRYWPHGMTHYKAANEANVDYLCSYILPDGDDDSADQHFRKSTKPPLGQQFSDNLARSYALQGLAPRNGIYTIPGVVLEYGKLKGLPKYFTWGDQARDRFLAAFVREWAALYPGRPLPESDYVQAHLERVARREVAAEVLHDTRAWANLRDRGSYYEPGPAKAVPGRFGERDRG